MQKCLLLILIINIISFSNASSQETNDNNHQYLPDLNGILKTKVEYDLNNSLTRFEVRNARFGARGEINPFFSYRAEIDLSDEGVIKMLDAYIDFSPIANLDIYLGQKKIPFSTDYMRSPADNMFANRSFVAKYINNGLRDIGLYINYKFTGNLPVDLFLGAVNGTGNNNPEWVEKPNVVGRVSLGPEKGIRGTINLYSGEVKYKESLSMTGGELRYTNGQFLVESEYVKLNYTDTTAHRIQNDGLYIHSFYNFELSNRMIHMLTPVARWDFMGNSVFRNNIDANRITLGLNAGFEPDQFHAEIRLNYEKYMKKDLPIHTDKLTLEFIARF
jgi:hypothetical protein